MNAFSAKLCSQGLPPGGEIQRGGKVLRTTLEKPWSPAEIKALDGWVPAAHQWIKYCAYELYVQDGDMGSEWPSKWKGKKGWSKERWAFWKQRFQWVTTLSPLKDSTREIAEWCVERMNGIDGGR